jgi:O-antigen/teichoic acid export membrane protein
VTEQADRERRLDEPTVAAVDSELDTEHVLDGAQAGRAALRGSALRSGGYVAGLGLSLISAPLLTRHLGPSRFGEYIAVTALVTVIAGLTEGGLNAIAVREYSTGAGAHRDAVMRDVIGIRLALSLLAVLVAIALAAIFGYSEVLVLGTAIAITGQMVQGYQTLLGTSLQGEMRFGWITWLELVRQTVSVALIVTLVLVGAGLLPFFAVPVVAAAATLSVTLRVTRGLIPLRPTLHPRRWWPLLRDTLPFAAAIAVSVLYFRVGVIAMSVLSTSLQTGYFSAAFRVIEVLVGVPPLIAGTAFPILARAVAQNDRERLHYGAGRLVEGTLVLGTLLSLVLLLGAKPLIAVLGGAEFAKSVPVLQIQGLALMANCVAVSAGFVLLAMREHRAILGASATALAASVGLAVLLIPPFAAKGGAVAVVLAESSLAIAMLVRLVRQRPGLRRVFLLRPLAIIGMGAAAATVGLIPGLPELIATAIGAAVFLGLLQLTGYMPPELRELLGGLRKTRGA